MRGLIVDPGKMTGWGFLDSGAGDTTFWGGELSHDDFVDWSSHLLAGSLEHPFEKPDYVLVEGFAITQRTVQQVPDDRKMWSVKQVGHLETLCRWHGVRFLRCMPADKSFDEKGTKLRALGWWDPLPGVKGEDGHRRDAGRHAVKYAVDHNLIDLRRLIA